MWTYRQCDGWLLDHSGLKLAQGYSGAGAGKNSVDAQAIEDVGPIPQGLYKIEPPVNTVTHGPAVLPLNPLPNNQMYGRSGFLIHGDSVVDPGNSSMGCVIMPRFARDRIAQSGDVTLKVVSGLPPVSDPSLGVDP